MAKTALCANIHKLTKSDVLTEVVYSFKTRSSNYYPLLGGVYAKSDVRRLKYAVYRFIILCKCLVTSHLEYAHSVWSPHEQYFMEEIVKVQKRAAQLVSACKKFSYEQRLIYLKLPTLKYRRYKGGYDRAMVLYSTKAGAAEHQ